LGRKKRLQRRGFKVKKEAFYKLKGESKVGKTK